MANYKVLVSSSVEKSLQKLPKKDVTKIITTIQTLAINPFPVNCRKLSGEENVFRVRVGDYRIIYELNSGELIILILKVGHRKDIYR